MPTNLTVAMGGQTLASKGMRGRSCGSVMTTAPSTSWQQPLHAKAKHRG